MSGRNLFLTGADAIKAKLSKILHDSFDFSYLPSMKHYLFFNVNSNSPVDEQLGDDINNLLLANPGYVYNSQLLAACCLTKRLTSGSSSTLVTYSLSPYILFLFERGAGIRCFLDCRIEGMASIRPQLFIGASAGFISEHYTSGSHIYHSSDIVRLFKRGKLTQADLDHLEKQAKHALDHGSFDEKLKTELINVFNLARFFGHFWIQLTEKQRNAYMHHREEMVVSLLQAQHQLDQVGVPKEMLYSILGNFVELNHHDIADLREKLINYHCESFPEAKARIKM